jgi:NADPH:quinone reductase-like Zn-dependent oxidoreductase
MKGRCLVAAIDSFGAATRLQPRWVPMPVAKDDEIVVEVEASSVNPIDVRRRAGYGRKLFSLLGATRMPLVLGNDFAGKICAVGTNVRGFREGDAVFGAKPPSSCGTHASHVVVNAKHAVLQPVGVTPTMLAALPYNFLTVSGAFADAGITRDSVSGRQVLVHGGSGGLGLIAIRLLHELGANITAVAGGTGLHACRTAGAATVEDRHTSPLNRLPRHFAATLNFANWEDETRLLHLLAPDAVGHATTVHPMLSHFDRYGLVGGAAAALYRKRRMAALAPKGAHYAWTFFRPNHDNLSILGERAASLSLPSPLTCFRVANAAIAHRHVEERRLGRAIVLPQPI